LRVQSKCQIVIVRTINTEIRIPFWFIVADCFWLQPARTLAFHF